MCVIQVLYTNSSDDCYQHDTVVLHLQHLVVVVSHTIANKQKSQ